MIEPIPALLLAALLIVIAGLVSAAETAMGRVSRSRAEELSKEAPARANKLKRIVDERARYVNVLLFVQLVCSTLAAVLVGEFFVSMWPQSPWSAVLVSTAVMVVIAFVVVGVAPRTIGRQNSERVALAAAGPTRLLSVFIHPVTQLLILLGNAVTPGKGYREGPFTSTAELRELVDLAEADMLIEDDERRMIHSVFELGDTVAREVMVPRTEMVWVEGDKTLRQALSLGLRSGYSRIPVVGRDIDDVIGVVYLKDVMRRVFDDRNSETTVLISSLMRPALFVPDSKRADVLLRDMQADRVHLAVVVDEYGGTAGIVTIEDVLEEIVGEIDDEYDTATPEVEVVGDSVYRVSARMHIDDLAELLDLEVDSDEEGIDTVGGLLGKRLGRVPIPGAEVVLGGWKLKAERTAGRRNRVGVVLVTRAAADEGETVDD